MIKEKLLNKIKNKDITVGVVGLGYVGLPLAVEKAKAGAPRCSGERRSFPDSERPCSSPSRRA